MAVDTSATAADGALAIPADVNRAGWWNGSARLGDPYGSIVVAAHVDSFAQGLGRFAELLGMQPGDRVRLAASGLSQRFKVVSAELVPKTSFGPSVFASHATQLVLITCGGSYDPARGGYQDNMVVIAEPDTKLQTLAR